uniref:Glycoside hydrolase family 13 N-terminal domain-containing protein n=1 Tax=Anopheles maculatus TaxID=74869 RepID=A0A182S7R1_9DIPT
MANEPKVNPDTLFELDPYLKSHEHEIRRRNTEFRGWIKRLNELEGGLNEFTQGYKYYGLHIAQDNSVVAREWAPGAKEVFLTGDFNNWQWLATPYEKLPFGKWELKIPPNPDGSCAIKHLSEIKVIIRKQDGALIDRLSPWAKYVVPPPKELGVNFQQRVWHPPAHEKYMFRHRKPTRPRALRIYECHVGIATEEYGVG